MALIPVPDLDTSPLTIGKYKGMTPEEISEVDPSYIVWLYENVEPKKCSKDLYILCEDLIADLTGDQVNIW